MKTKLVLIGFLISVLILSLSFSYTVEDAQYFPDQHDTTIACGTSGQPGEQFGNQPDDDLCDDIRGAWDDV